MKITVVGYWHGYPEKGEATSGYLLEKNGYHLLLDCGSGVISNVQRFCSLDQLDGIVLSHYHHDHKADIGVFHYARIIQHSLGKTMKNAAIYGHRQDEASFQSLAYGNVVEAKSYSDTGPLQIGPFSFTFLLTNHPVPCYAMRIEDGERSFVYTADSSYMEELATFAHECDLLIAECSGYGSQDVAQFGHMNSYDVGKLATKAQAKKLLLTHLPHAGDHEQLRDETATIYHGDISVARLGWTNEG
ncbi:MBL fold metallo-hydrolase [Halalkalibacterium ligniniphilum]|uniref:MBL fold metallo-hydrolase n=1 Tax=Halalkalibacterium ligniniphilum TaxID=1134413 RepID=UPI00034C88D2|nr:MBL fold metallo-hydrolase [Halalkalibacterium ligniniphilum]